MGAEDPYPYVAACESEEDVEHYVSGIISRVAVVEALKENMPKKIRVAENDLYRYCEGHLPAIQHYFDMHSPKKGARSIHLDVGRIGYRTTPGGPRVVDVAECTEWCTENLESALEAQPPKLDQKKVKAYVEKMGEIPPGVEIIDDRNSFYFPGSALYKKIEAKKHRGDHGISES